MPYSPAVDPEDTAIMWHNVDARAFQMELIYVYRTKVARGQVGTL